MAHQQARAWWADVEHLREDFERRRAAERGERPVAAAPRAPRRPTGDERAEPPAGRRPAATEEHAVRPARRTPPGEAARERAVREAARVEAGRRLDAWDEPAWERPRRGEESDDQARPADAPSGGRRTIQIRGQVAPPARRRPAPTTAERAAAKPDRVAAWAVGLGLLLIGVAAGTADAAPL